MKDQRTFVAMIEPGGEADRRESVDRKRVGGIPAALAAILAAVGAMIAGGLPTLITTPFRLSPIGSAVDGYWLFMGRSERSTSAGAAAGRRRPSGGARTGHV